MSSHSTVDETHDPSRESWVEGSAAGTSFPIQNLPFCTFAMEGAHRVGVGIGDYVLDLYKVAQQGLLDATLCKAMKGGDSSLQDLMGWSQELLTALRRQIFMLLSLEACDQAVTRRCLHAQRSVELLAPARPGNFTDFFTSIHHARNAGRLRRPENPLLPNFHHLPAAYNGRASSVRASGTPVVRPYGQVLLESGLPAYLPTSMLDFEAELALWIGPGTQLGQKISLADAHFQLFGVGLLNDWSARDLQLWESQPLGPLLSKSFHTTVSPWVITRAALAPFFVRPAAREADAPPLLPHLDDARDREAGGLSVRISVDIQTASMRARGIAPQSLSRPAFSDHYWTVGQMLTHLTSNGCNLEPGDLVGSGTVSGPSAGELGCLLEITQLGKAPIALAGGERRTWLRDGDEVILSGVCEAPGRVSIGLGEARARVSAALPK